ncbi:MAG: c-type cytochrome [Sulfurimonas sp.]|uniref:c-type cytochrome n=1 Tax=Sulfurimonas sp. TaxID=2022749 RepID=UPI00262F4D65|nr:c-type cytochrome [Sulfurimonas sp.]MDD5373980.1 c-type cytochrome [Sulfurimonas sp.]
MKKIVSLSLLAASFTVLFASVDAEELAVKKCGECHLMGVVSAEKLKNMKAPPYWAIAKKARENYENKEDKIKYITDYAINPSEEKMLFPKETKTMFGVMKSQKDKVTESELKLIAEYIIEEKSF